MTDAALEHGTTAMTLVVTTSSRLVRVSLSRPRSRYSLVSLSVTPKTREGSSKVRLINSAANAEVTLIAQGPRGAITCGEGRKPVTRPISGAAAGATVRITRSRSVI